MALKCHWLNGSSVTQQLVGGAGKPLLRHEAKHGGANVEEPRDDEQREGPPLQCKRMKCEEGLNRRGKAQGTKETKTHATTNNSKQQQTTATRTKSWSTSWASSAPTNAAVAISPNKATMAATAPPNLPLLGLPDVGSNARNPISAPATGVTMMAVMENARAVCKRDHPAQLDAPLHVAVFLLVEHCGHRHNRNSHTKKRNAGATTANTRRRRHTAETQRKEGVPGR